MVSPFEVQHFDDSTVRVNRNGVALDRFIKPNGLTDAEIISLSGAPSNHTVEVEVLTKQYWAAQPDGDVGRPGLYFRVLGPWIERGQRHLVGVFRENGATCLYIKDVFFTKGLAPAALAGTMVKRMARVATRLGFKNIQLLAAGGRFCQGIPGRPGERYWGFYAWAQYGFDMPLDKNNRAIVPYFPYHPPKLAGCNTVQEVLALEGGDAYWRVNGDGNFMTFTLRSNRSERKLLARVALKEGTL